MGKIGEVPDRVVVDFLVGRNLGGGVRISPYAPVSRCQPNTVDVRSQLVNPGVCTPFDEGLKCSTELREQLS